MPKLTIIIPTYKPQTYLWECFASLSAQTLSKECFEVLLVLNGCNEPYKSDIERHIAENMQGVAVRLIQTDTPGVSNARNIGIEEASGEYIAFIDDDDYVSPTYLEELMSQAAPGTVVFSDVLPFDDETGAISEEYFMHRSYLRNVSVVSPTLFGVRALLNGPCNKVLHRDIIGECRFNPRFRNSEDSLMMLEISDKIRHLKFTSESAVYYYRQRSNSASSAYRSTAAKLMNSMRLMLAFTRTVLKSPFSYNYPFILSRYAATIKSSLFD